MRNLHVALVLVVVWLAACVQPEEQFTPFEPPAGLGYPASSAVYTLGVAIAANTPTSTGGAVESYDVAPALPAGLSLSTATGAITGTPIAITPSASYVVTATNHGGSTTTSLSITVNDVAPAGLTYATNPATYTRNEAIPPNVPHSTGGAVTSYAVAPSLPTGLSLSTTTGVISGTPSVLGSAASYVVTAMNASGSTTASVSIAVTDAMSQTISFTSTAPSSATIGGATYAVTATASSGLAVVFSIDATASAVCTISNAVVSFIAAGTCVIDADQPGDASYNPAPQVQQMVAVGKQSQTISFTSTAPSSATVGGATYTVAATATSGLAVELSIDASSSAVCAISGAVVSFTGAGTCVIDANQAGDGTFSAAPQLQQSFAVAAVLSNQTIMFTSPPPAATVQGPAYVVTAMATSGLPVVFTIDGMVGGVCTIAGSTVSFTGVGTCIIDANQGGNGSFNPAPQQQQSFVVAKGSQTISFTSSPPAATFGGPSYTVTATATSGLAVAFTSASPTICTVAGSTVSFVGAGTCVINGDQAGNANFNAAATASQLFAVGKASQTIAFTSMPPPDAFAAGPTYAVAAMASSGLPVALTIDGSASAVCTISGTTVSFIGAGTCVIDANQAGDASFNAAPQVQQSFAVLPVKMNQTIAFTSPPPGGAVFGGPAYTVTATASSGLPVSFTIDGTSAGVCSITGATVSFTGVGTCVIDANQPGNTMFNPAPQVQQSFAIGKASQTITFNSTAPVNAVFMGPAYDVNVTSSSGLVVALSSTTPAVCTVSGFAVSFTGVGTCTLVANQAGNPNFNAAGPVQQTFSVAKSSQTITFTSVPPVNATLGGSYVVTAAATSGLPVVLLIDISATSVCALSGSSSGSTVTYLTTGTCLINAGNMGNANYLAAPKATQSFVIH